MSSLNTNHTQKQQRLAIYKSKQIKQRKYLRNVWSKK